MSDQLAVAQHQIACLCWAGCTFLQACLSALWLIVLPHPTLCLITLRASSDFCNGSQQELCHWLLHLLTKGNMFVLPSSHSYLYWTCCLPEVMLCRTCIPCRQADSKLCVCFIIMYTYHKCIYRQEEVEFIQGNFCFSRIWKMNSQFAVGYQH